MWFWYYHDTTDGFEALTFTHCWYLFWHLHYLWFLAGISEMQIELARMNLKICWINHTQATESPPRVLVAVVSYLCCDLSPFIMVKRSSSGCSPLTLITSFQSKTQTAMFQAVDKEIKWIFNQVYFLMESIERMSRDMNNR